MVSILYKFPLNHDEKYAIWYYTILDEYSLSPAFNSKEDAIIWVEKNIDKQYHCLYEGFDPFIKWYRNGVKSL